MQLHSLSSKHLALALCVLMTTMACDGSQATDQSKGGSGTGSGGKTTDPTPRCDELDHSGTVGLKKDQLFWTLPNGQIAAVTQANDMNTASISDPDALTFQDPVGCSHMYDAMKLKNAKGYEGANPIVSTERTFTKSATLDGANLVVSPTAFTGLDVTMDVLSKLDVVCQADGQHKKVVRYKKLYNGRSMKCVYPTEYSTVSAALSLVPATPIQNFKAVCVQPNILFPGTCLDEYSNYGGILTHHSNLARSLESYSTVFAWGKMPIDVEKVIADVHSALNIAAERPIHLRALSNEIHVDDLQAVRAIGLSSTGSPDGVRSWALTTPHAHVIGDTQAFQSLAQAPLSIETPSTFTNAVLKPIYAKLSESFHFSEMLMNWNPVTRQTDRSVPQGDPSRWLGLVFHEAMSEAFASHKPVSVYLVWTPSDESLAVLTHFEINEDGAMSASDSKVIDPEVTLGLPADLLAK